MKKHYPIVGILIVVIAAAFIYKFLKLDHHKNQNTSSDNPIRTSVGVREPTKEEIHIVPDSVIIQYYQDEELYLYISQHTKMAWVLKMTNKCPSTKNMKSLQAYHIEMVKKYSEIEPDTKDYQLLTAMIGFLCDISKKYPARSEEIKNGLNEIMEYTGDNYDNGYSFMEIFGTLDQYQCCNLKTDKFWEKVKNSNYEWIRIMEFYSHATRCDDNEILKAMLNDETLDPRKKEDIKLCLRNRDRFKKNLRVEDTNWQYKPK